MNHPWGPLIFHVETLCHVLESNSASKDCDLLERTCFYSRSAGPQRIMYWATVPKALLMFRAPAANVKVSCCQIVKSYLRRKVWEEGPGARGAELQTAGGNREETITHTQDRPGHRSRRNKIPGPGYQTLKWNLPLGFQDIYSAQFLIALENQNSITSDLEGSETWHTSGMNSCCLPPPSPYWRQSFICFLN